MGYRRYDCHISVDSTEGTIYKVFFEFRAGVYASQETVGNIILVLDDGGQLLQAVILAAVSRFDIEKLPIETCDKIFMHQCMPNEWCDSSYDSGIDD